MAGALTALGIARLKEPGRYTDGAGGLILQVTRNASGEVRRSWLVRYTFAGKRREMGVGPHPGVSLASAREIAVDVSRRARNGEDPVEARRAERRRLALEHARRLTFKDCAERYIAAHEPSWANPKHRQQWRNTLATYVYPEFGDLDVKEVGVGDVMRVIEPLWSVKTETASRVRGRIETILSWAIARGHREGPNPALWRGHLDALLPPRSRVRPVRHHAALDWRRVPEFVAALRARPALSARALEFTILTAARSAEVRLARWSEVDLDEGLWIVPAERMKLRRAHRVPLSDRARELLIERRAEEARDKGSRADALLFPSSKPDRPFSDSVYRALYERMDMEGVTTHGFRSAFRDWCGEATSYPREVAEHALAHKAGDAVELAYRRGDALEKRRALMADWAAYCGES